MGQKRKGIGYFTELEEHCRRAIAQEPRAFDEFSSQGRFDEARHRAFSVLADRALGLASVSQDSLGADDRRRLSTLALYALIGVSKMEAMPDSEIERIAQAVGGYSRMTAAA